MADIAIQGWPKFHCIVGDIAKVSIYTWAQDAAAAARQVAAFEDVPLHWVTVQPMNAAQTAASGFL